MLGPTEGKTIASTVNSSQTIQVEYVLELPG